MIAQFAAFFDAAIWFWAAALAFWWRACSATLGVPNDLLARAARDPADAALFEAMARRNARLAAEAWARGGATTVALSAFLICFAAGYAALRRDPTAGAFFCLIAPFAAHHILSARAARRICAEAPEGAALRRRFDALRLRSYAAAAASLALAALLRGAARAASLYG